MSIYLQNMNAVDELQSKKRKKKNKTKNKKGIIGMRKKKKAQKEI